MSYKIAVIEDDEIMQKLIGEELKDAGYEVLLAADGVEGLDLVRKEHPDLVLLDLLMPKKNGHEVLSEIRKDPSLSKMPVVILTVSSTDQSLRRAITEGATDYIIKSHHDISEIAKKIEVYLKTKDEKNDNGK